MALFKCAGGGRRYVGGLTIIPLIQRDLARALRNRAFAVATRGTTKKQKHREKILTDMRQIAAEPVPDPNAHG